MAYDLLGIELIIAFVVILPALYLFAMAVRRRMVKGHVWFHIDLPSGRTHRGHQKPDENGDLHALKGTYHTRADSFTLAVPGWAIPEAPLFRYVKGKSWPLKPERKAVYEMRPAPVDSKAPAAANGGMPEVKMVPTLVGYEAYYESQTMPAEEQEVFLHQKLFADAYGGREKLILLVIVLLVVVLVMVIAVLARTH